MNIFVLDTDAKKCAAYHCDKHLIKMITEHNQILGSIAHTARGIKRKSEITPDYVWKNFKGFPRVDFNQEPFPYGIGYKTHPCTQWAGASEKNYQWLCDLTFEMCKEYTKRYSKIHAGERICEWYKKNPPTLPKVEMTPFAQAMPAECKNSDAIIAYRTYYATHKSYFASWKIETPSWWFSTLSKAYSQNLINERSLPFAKKILEERTLLDVRVS